MRSMPLLWEILDLPLLGLAKMFEITDKIYFSLQKMVEMTDKIYFSLQKKTIFDKLIKLKNANFLNE